MGFCAFIGKHIHVFQNVLFLIEIMFIFLRPPLPVFSLNCYKYFSSKEDLHFWTEPTKRDESFSLFLCSVVLWLLLSQTLCPVMKSDATDLEGCGTHSHPKTVIHYLLYL